MKHLLLRAALVLSLATFYVACGNQTPAGIPPTPTSGVAVMPPATDLPPESILPKPTPELVATATITATATVSATVQPAELTALQALNTRSGPGLEYPVVGWLAAGVRVEIIGRSPDSAWWRIRCPIGLQVEQCWVIGSETLTQAVFATAVVTAPIPAIPPPPQPTAPPTPTPCVAAQPTGWLGYAIRGGDTLSGIAAMTGTSVTTLMAVNCLSSDVIVTGNVIWVPATGAPVAAGQPDMSDIATQPSPPVFIPPGVAPTLKNITDPTTGRCVAAANGPSSDSFAMTIADLHEGVQPKITWEALQTVCIYLSGVNENGPEPTFILYRPGAAAESLPITLVPDPAAPSTRQKGLATFLMDRAQGSHVVVARQGDSVQTAEVRATVASEPRLVVDPLIDPRNIAAGATVKLYHAGFPPQRQFYLYGYEGNDDQPCQPLQAAGIAVESPSYCLLGRIAYNAPVATGVSALWVSASQLVPGGSYRVHTGLMTPEESSVSRRFQVQASATSTP